MSIKKLLIGLFVFISVTQISCKKDSSSGASASIIGKWTLQSSKSKVTYPGQLPTEQTLPGNGITAEFKTNGIVEYCEGSCSNLFYKISGNTLTVSELQDYSDPFVNTIQSLTSNSLVLYSKEIETLQGDNIVYEYTETYTR
jgi:hypothetical protein